MDIKRLAASTPTLYSRRLCLSRILVSDARAMYRYSKLKSVTRYLTWAPHKSLRYTRSYLKLLQEKYDSFEFFDWGVHDERGRFIGTCGFTKFHDDGNGAEIGYVLSPTVWGQGYAKEAAECVMEFAFTTLGLKYITARFLYGNHQSERVMQKLGMQAQGILPESMCINGIWKTVLEYKITKEEFQKQRLCK